MSRSPYLLSILDPGYELYLKLMTEFPLPEEQYEIMDLESLELEEAGLDSPSPKNTFDPGKARTREMRQ